MRRDRKSSWEGEQWIVAQEKEGLVMVKLIKERKKKKIPDTGTTKSLVFFVEVLELFLRCPILILMYKWEL
jgi:hypothetical protein